MELSVAQGGKFSFTIKSKELSHGLRPSKSNPRDNDYLITCIGAIGKNGVLQATEELTRIATDIITEGFPFPQIFTFTNLTIVCGVKDIYEWDGTTLNLKFTVEDESFGGVWTAVDFYDYVYLSNGKVAVVRSASDYTYAVSELLPSTTAVCNYNGQVIIGAPDADAGELGVGGSILFASPIIVEVSQLGSWS